MRDDYSYSADLLDYFEQPVFLAVNGRITDCNLAAKQDLVMEGMELEDYIQPEDWSFYEAHTSQEPLYLHVLLAGKPCSAIMLTEPQGQLFIVTQQKEQSLQLPPSMLTGVNHALRAPMTNLMNCAESVARELRDTEDPETRQKVMSLRRELYRLMHLACGVSDMIGVLTDDFRVVRERMDLSSFLKDVCTRAEPLCECVDVELECDVPAEAVTAWIDQQKLERAILNAVCNALKFRRKEDARITVQMQTDEEQNWADIRISDNGEGIRPGELTDIYRRYLRGRQLSDPRWGLGFGLPMLLQTARFHNGSAAVESSPENGTTVHIRLPLDTPSPYDTRLGSPNVNFDYTGGFRHELVELADALPGEAFLD